MPTLQRCADGAIDGFVHNDLGSPPWPNWAALKPTDWGADKASWRVQAGSMITDFETCCGVKITCPDNELDGLHDMTLSDFSVYLVQKAQLHSAMVAVSVAQEHLNGVQARITAFPVQ
jgi:hypothetical protein